MPDRYERQVMLKELGAAGQEKLRASSALVVGAGGLGSPVLFNLAAAGVGHIHVTDPDAVSISNLNRQFLHFERDIGRMKAFSAAEKLQSFNSQINITSSVQAITENNAADMLYGFDIAVSCVDNLPARVLLNKTCVKSRIPLVDGGVQGFYGYVLTVLPGVTPCYRCIYPEAKLSPGPAGVLGGTACTAGSIMAVQAIKCLLGMQSGSKLLVFDLSTFSFTAMETERKPDCPVCGDL